MRKLFALMLLLMFALPAAAADVGYPAPDFSVKDTKGRPESLAAYRGKILVLEWANPQCPFTRKHYSSGNMQGLQRYAESQGAAWLTVDSSAPGKQGYMNAAEANAWVASQDAHPTAFILDPEGSLGHLYGAAATPHMFVIAPSGVLVYKGAIDDKPDFNPETVAGAHNYVRAAIDAMVSGSPVAMPSTQAYGCSIKYGD